MSRVEFHVSGIPAPAGSKKAFSFRRKDGRLGVSVSPASARSKPWMAVVSVAAAKYVAAPFVGPVVLELEFVMPRPKNHFRTGKHEGEIKLSKRSSAHITTPDLTKLVRCAEDAMKGVAWNDDSQVVSQITTKRYASQNGWTGVIVRIYEWDTAVGT